MLLYVIHLAVLLMVLVVCADGETIGVKENKIRDARRSSAAVGDPVEEYGARFAKKWMQEMTDDVRARRSQQQQQQRRSSKNLHTMTDVRRRSKSSAHAPGRRDETVDRAIPDDAVQQFVARLQPGRPDEATAYLVWKKPTKPGYLNYRIEYEGRRLSTGMMDDDGRMLTVDPRKELVLSKYNSVRTIPDLIANAEYEITIRVEFDDGTTGSPSTVYLDTTPDARRIHVIDLKKEGGTGNVFGLATRANKLYVGRYQPTMETYDASTFQRIVGGGLNFTFVGCISDMTSCPQCDVVYAADGCYNLIYAIDDRGVTRQFNVPSLPTSLSVNAQSNLLVTFNRERKLREYTPSGELVREINLQSEPHHAIQLDNGRYVVSHRDYGNDLIRVCVVNGNGEVIKCYAVEYGSGVGQMQTPRQLALLGESTVIVTDGDNNKILLLNLSSMTLQEEIYLGGITPNNIETSEDGTRLYISETHSGGEDFMEYFIEISVYDLS